MSTFFKKLARSYNTIVLSSGLVAYSYLIYNKFNVDRKLAQPVVQEVLDRLKTNQEVTEIVGNQFIVTTGLFKSLYIKAQETKDSMEYVFNITGTKGKDLSVYFSAIAKEHKAIKDSPDWETLEVEYFLPTEGVAKIIDEAENKEHLKNISIGDRTKFWKIEYIEGIKKHNVIDIKDPVPSALYGPKVTKRSTYYDIYNQIKVG